MCTTTYRYRSGEDNSLAFGITYLRIIILNRKKQNVIVSHTFWACSGQHPSTRQQAADGLVNTLEIDISAQTDLLFQTLSINYIVITVRLVKNVTM